MKKILSALTAVALIMASLPAHAGMHRDAAGNVGYDTLQECQAALANGSAKFYQSHTHKPPLLRGAEKTVRQVRLGELHEAFRAGTCDVGTGHRLGRDGVSKALQGKYIPYSPDMTLNAYSNAKGEVVRVTMQQCDNWFSGNFPKATLYNPASAPTNSAVTTPSATIAPTPVAPTPVASVPAMSPSAVGSTTTGSAATGTVGSTATGAVGTSAGSTATSVGSGVAKAGVAKAGVAKAGAAVAAAQGATSMIIPLAVLGAIGVGTAVIMNNDASTGGGTTGTTGTVAP